MWGVLQSLSSGLVVLLVFCVAMWVRRQFAQKLSRAAETLLAESSYAIHYLLNTYVPGVQTEFEDWDQRVQKKLDELQSKKLCNARHVHHFRWLGTTPPVASPLGNPQLAGQIATKAERLKDIAGELYQRASRVWPLPL